jgi:hypothetical protein
MIAKLEDVKHGNMLWHVTVYKVQGLKKAFLESREIFGSIYKSSSGFDFCKCKKDGSSFVSEFSLLDANIIPNSYNEHMSFTTEAEAYSYMGAVLGRNEISSSVVTNLRKENTDLKRVLRVMLESTSPMEKINAVLEARGFLVK